MENIIKKILEKENVNYKNISKATSGFTNLVYFIDNNFVIKLSKDEKTKEKLLKEISIYKNIKMENIPSYVASGDYENYKYLIISKLSGKSLYSVWHTLEDVEREGVVIQIAKILKQFNLSDASFLDSKYRIDNWIKYISEELNLRANDLKQMGFQTQHLENFIKNNLERLFTKNKFGLVYNDAHFDNFLIEKGKVYIIDFDRVVYAPIDFEMLIFKLMCDMPLKFASEEDEDKIKDEDYNKIYSQFKQEYPQMFEHSYVDERIYVYHFNYLIKQAIGIKDREWIGKLMVEFETKFLLLNR